MRKNSKEQYASKLTKREMQLESWSLIVLFGDRHDKSFKNMKEVFEKSNSICSKYFDSDCSTSFCTIKIIKNKTKYWKKFYKKTKRKEKPYLAVEKNNGWCL